MLYFVLTAFLLSIVLGLWLCCTPRQQTPAPEKGRGKVRRKKRPVRSRAPLYLVQTGTVGGKNRHSRRSSD